MGNEANATVTDSANVEGATTGETAAPVAEANPNAPLVALLDTDKVKSIRSALGDRSIFESDETATAYQKAEKHFVEAAGKTASFHGLPVLSGTDIETARRIVVATVGVRDKGGEGIAARNGYKAIVLFSQPRIEDFLADESDNAKDFVRKLIEREASDVAFAGIRSAETLADLQTVMSGLPATVAEIVDTSRATSGGVVTSFDIMWNDFRRGVLKKQQETLEKHLPKKDIVLKAIRSASYAKKDPTCAPIETHDLFTKIAKALIVAGTKWQDEKGNPDPLDTSDIQSWIDSRDSVHLDYGTPVVEASTFAGLDF